MGCDTSEGVDSPSRELKFLDLLQLTSGKWSNEFPNSSLLRQAKWLPCSSAQQNFFFAVRCLRAEGRAAMAAILTRDLGTKRKRTKQGRKYGKTSLREELQPCNCKILGRKYGKGSPREELQPYNCKILGRKYGKGSPREELQPYKLNQRLYQHRPQIAKNQFLCYQHREQCNVCKKFKAVCLDTISCVWAPSNGTTSTPPKMVVFLPPNHSTQQWQQWRHSPRLGRPSPFPQRSTLQWHPAMTPSNGTTSTPPKLAVTLPPQP